MTNKKDKVWRTRR